MESQGADTEISIGSPAATVLRSDGVIYFTQVYLDPPGKKPKE